MIEFLWNSGHQCWRFSEAFILAASISVEVTCWARESSFVMQGVAGGGGGVQFCLEGVEVLGTGLAAGEQVEEWKLVPGVLVWRANW